MALVILKMKKENDEKNDAWMKLIQKRTSDVLELYQLCYETDRNCSLNNTTTDSNATFRQLNLFLDPHLTH